LEACLSQLAAGSKDYEVISALRDNIRLRRENLLARQELEDARVINRLLKAQREARRRGKERASNRRMRIRRNALRRMVQE
jgi:hypothetical protein